MSYPGQPPNQRPMPPIPTPYGPPPADTSGRILKLSGAALIWTVAGVIVLCVIGPIVMCLLCGVGGLMGGVTNPYPTPTVYP